MSYLYAAMRSHVFTEGGQVMFLKIRDRTARLLDEAGAAMLQNMISGNTGDSWLMLACVDRMVELGEIREVTDPETVMGQHRVFVRGRQ